MPVTRRKKKVVAGGVPRPLLDVVSEWKGWRPAREVLVDVRSVPTMFLDLDRALRVGGFPLGRFYVVHGPTSGGKTSFVLGLLRSFLERGHIAGYVDAEHTTPEKWVRQMMLEASAFPTFLASRPKSYEETIDAVDTLIRGVAAARKERPELAAIVVVDSLNKLVPERELATLVKKGGDAIDKGWGRYRAAMNQAWIDHLTPLLAAHDVALVAIAQEREKKNATEADHRYGSDYQIKGGMGILYDSSLVMRVQRASWLREKKDDGESAGPAFGARHVIEVHKSKVEWLDGARSKAYFHVLNGADGNPAGFDVPRDLLSLGVEAGVVTSSGAWYSYARRRWQGEARAIAAIRADHELAVALERDVRASIPTVGGA